MSLELVGELNRLAGTTGLEAAAAANAIAGTSRLELVGALNAAAGTTGLELNAACKAMADLYGGDSSLDAAGALASISELTPPEEFALLLESDDALLLESGDGLLLESGDAATKISELDDAGAASGANQVAVVQAGATVRMSISEIVGLL